MSNKYPKSIVLTGSTGTFGRFLVYEFLKYNNVKLTLLVRGASQQKAYDRVREIIGKENERVDVFRADLTKEYLGLSKLEYNELCKRTTIILHSAASTRFNLPLEEARLHNVKTTKNVLHFAKDCSRLVRFGFVGTALVAGKRSGLILESEFEHNEGFKNTYEQSKYEAEALVHADAQELPIAIFRPPLIIAPVLPKSSKKQINLLALAMSFIARGYLPFIPGTENSTMDIVSGTDAAKIICELMLKEHLSHITYHITNGAEAPTLKAIQTLIEQELGKTVSLEFCGDEESFMRRVRKIPWYRSDLRLVYKRAASFLPEAAYPKIFDNRNTLSELKVKHIGENPINILRQSLQSKLWSLSE